MLFLVPDNAETMIESSFLRQTCIAPRRHRSIFHNQLEFDISLVAAAGAAAAMTCPFGLYLIHTNKHVRADPHAEIKQGQAWVNRNNSGTILQP